MADIQVTNTDSDLSGNTLLTEEEAYTITGLHTYNRSTNPPFAVASGAAKVDNLDADKLDGQTGTYYLAAANATGTLSVAQGGTGLSSYAAGDVIYASGTTTLAKLAKATDGDVLTLASGVPSWATPTVGDITAVTAGAGMTGGGTTGDVTLNVIGTTDKITVSADAVTIASGYVGQTSITTLGTIATGVWEGTDVAVSHGGTGVSSLTAGGLRLGSGTGDITALAVATDGQIPIGDGAGDPVLATITGTTEQVTVTNGAGSITLSLPIGDYEEGTFTPTYYGQTTAGTLSGGTIEGRYTRIGRTITVYVNFNAVTMTGAAGKARIGGFPSNIEAATAIACPQQYNLPISADYNTIYLISNVADIYTNGDGAGWAQEDVYNGQFWLTFTATYEFA